MNQLYLFQFIVGCLIAATLIGMGFVLIYKSRSGKFAWNIKIFAIIESKASGEVPGLICIIGGIIVFLVIFLNQPP